MPAKPGDIIVDVVWVYVVRIDSGCLVEIYECASGAHYFVVLELVGLESTVDQGFIIS